METTGHDDGRWRALERELDALHARLIAALSAVGPAQRRAAQGRPLNARDRAEAEPQGADVRTIYVPQQPASGPQAFRRL